MTTKLSDTQLVILSAACQRPDLSIYPLATKLPGGAAAKVLTSLLNKGLVEEVDAKRGEPQWRQNGDGHSVTLVATSAAFAALGIEPEVSPDSADPGATEREEEEPAAQVPEGAEPAPQAPAAKRVRKARKDTKQALLVELLRTEDGATIAEMISATGWQAHTLRGALAGALKKKLGLTITSEKVEGKGRVYRVID